MKKYKIGILGLDRGAFVLDYEKYISDRLEVVAICETKQEVIERNKENGKLRDSVKLCDTFDELLDSGIDAVVLCDYFNTHWYHAVKAFEKGVAVFSDTTAAPTYGECVKLVEAYEKYNAKYMLGSNCVCARAIHAMKNIYESGKYGDLVFAEGEYIHPMHTDVVETVSGFSKDIDPENLHWRQCLPPCYYNMHDLGPLLFMTNSVPKKVLAKAVVTDKSEKPLVNFDKNFCLVTTESGAVISYTGCVGIGTMSKWFRMGLRDGTLETKRYDTPLEYVLEADRHNAPTETKYSWSESGTLTKEEEEKYISASNTSDPHAGLDMVVLVDFLNYLDGTAEPLTDIYRGVDLSSTSITALRSMIEKKELDIPNFRNKQDRDAYRNDFRSPFAKRVEDITLSAIIK